MKDHYNMKKQWALTLESWDKSTKKSDKVNTKEACGKSHTSKKKMKEEDGGAVAGATVSSGAPGSVGGDDGGYDSDSENNIAVNAKKVGKKKTPQTRHGKMGEEINLVGDMELPPEIDEDPEANAANDELINLYHRESIQRTLDEAFNKALYAESIAFQEEEDEDMGMEDEISDVDEPEMSLGGDELPLGDEPEEMIEPDSEGEEIPEGGINSDVNTRLDKIEGMLQQLLDIESSDGEEVISDIEGEDASDLMGDIGMEEPVIDEPMGMDEPVMDDPEEPTLDDETL